MHRRPFKGTVFPPENLKRGPEGVRRFAQRILVVGALGDGLKNRAQIFLDEGPFGRRLVLGEKRQAPLVGIP